MLKGEHRARYGKAKDFFRGYQLTIFPKQELFSKRKSGEGLMFAEIITLRYKHQMELWKR